MNKANSSIKKSSSKLIAKIEDEAKAQNKSPRVYLAEQSDGLRRMFIRWHKAEIKQLENIQSTSK